MGDPPPHLFRPVRLMVTGRRRRGKDTLVDYLWPRLVRLAELQGSPLHRLAFARAVKREAAELVGWYEGLTPEEIDRLEQRSIRERGHWGLLWQFWGEWRRQQQPDYWIQRVAEQLGPADGAVLTDARYPNELAWGRQHRFFIVRVHGPLHHAPDERLDPRADDHPSEQLIEQLDPALIDCELENTGSLTDYYWQIDRELWPALVRAFGDACTTCTACTADTPSNLSSQEQ
jgi:hypothetical protein